MPEKLRWGCLGAAKFALKTFLPAIPGCSHAELYAIASRDPARAREAADLLGAGKAYGSYDELLADPNVDVIYNPLPNHLHLEWSAKAADAGKHVLCEKPIGLNAAEVRDLMAARDRNRVKIGEAFMVRTHPQWLRARELARSGAIGQLRAVAGFLSYFNNDPGNIRNSPETGGGALYDVGCYTITTSRWLFGEEPTRVCGAMDRDPDFGTDRLTSAVMEFPSGQAIWTVATQLVQYQRVQILGTTGRIDIEIPFNAPNDTPCRLYIDDGQDKSGRSARIEEIPVCDQYTIEVNEFSRAVLEDTEVPVPLEESLSNMAAIDAVFESVERVGWAHT